MPFPNEHSCRINDPKKYKKFRRVNNEQTIDGKPVDVIYGILAPKKSEIQALRFRTAHWKAAQARAVCRRRKGSFEPATGKQTEKKWVDERVEEVTDMDEEIPESENGIVETARWTRKFINSLPNGAFAVIEPAYTRGETKDKSARHLPYKDNKGSVDLPHLRNALARMNQIEPVTDSISTDELRARARRKLIPLAKKHLPGSKWAKEGNKKKTSEEFTLSLSNMKSGAFETIKDEDDMRVMQFELMDNKKLYNGVRFPKEALEHQYNVFQEAGFPVFHGLDHSGKTLDQLGEVFEMGIEYSGEDNEFATVIITSKHFKETYAQKQAAILFDQGMLNFISGGWRARVTFNDDTEEFEVIKPILREVSSTPIPAKTDAKKLENVCASLLSDLLTDDAPDMEEYEMTDEIPEPQEPSPEEGAEEQGAEYVALKEKVDAIEAESQARTRASLLERAAELGLSADDFEGVPNAVIEKSLEVAKKAVVSALRENRPDTPIGGEGDEAFKDGSPEMLEFLDKNIYRSDLLED